MGSGGTSGVVTDDSETFRLGNLESEVVGETSIFTLTQLTFWRRNYFFNFSTPRI